MAAALLDGDISAHGASGRTLEYALVASLGLHLALFVVFPAVHFASLAPPKQPPLVARLEPAQPAPAAVPQAPVVAPPEEEKPLAKPVVRRPRAKPVVGAMPVSKAPPPPAPVAPQPEAAVAEVAPVAPVVQPAAAAVAAPAPIAEQPSEAMLAQYRLAVIEAARRYKRYPRVALDNNWQGRAEVRMAIGTDGTISALSVRASSGHEILDREALDMIRRAKPLTPIPATLRGTAFTVDIPVVFSLETPES
ncbi:MAG TPA: energy transducer TonB [Burkholderiales bacterium]|nr:energy transducer TonB [Burkholderiales bacterium]